MSIVADFASRLHSASPASFSRNLTSISFPSREKSLTDIRAVIFDVYGTLLNYWRPEFDQPGGRDRALLGAFCETVAYFGFADALTDMNPEESPEKTIHDLYHGLITLNHEKSIEKGVTFPEVRIEEVWMVILMMLRRHGFDSSRCHLGDDRDLAKCVAYYYNYQALGRQLYPGVADALVGLKEKNMVLGIVSNAQFYTPIDLTLLLRDQSGGRFDDYTEIFDPDLVVLSYEIGYSKPNPGIFRKLFDALYEFHILPSQTVFVGNDLLQDISPAQEAGMKGAFFVGDDKSAFVHDAAQKVVPDVCFSSWDELPRLLSFHAGANGS